MFFKRHPHVGAQPGTLVVDATLPKPRIHVMDFTEARVDEADIDDVGRLADFIGGPAVSWIDVQGMGDEAIIRGIADVFGFHPLLLEDVVNVPQRPKCATYPEHLLIVGRMPRLLDGGRVDREQVSFCIGEYFVITFQERHGDVFDPVRQRIRNGKAAIRRAGPDYLAYALIDVAVDAYYPILEGLGEHLEDLETEVLRKPSEDTLQKIFSTKRELLELRRSIWPQREVYSALIREDHPFVTADTRVFLRDTYDHCIQVIDVLETYRELSAGLLDVYMSSVGNRMNEVMKVLTIMASIFIPITFLAGVYGMNFDRMPELHVGWAYPAVLVVMGGVVAGMLWFFHRRGWIGSR